MTLVDTRSVVAGQATTSEGNDMPARRITTTKPTATTKHRPITGHHVDQETNADLVQLILMGDRDAETRLFARHHGFMRGVVSVARLPSHEWDDCIQTSWERSMRSLERLRDPKSFKSWLATITRNEAVTMHRRRNREQPSSAVDLDCVVDTDVDANLLKADSFTALAKALETLDNADRRLIDLLFVQRQPYKAVAAEIGCRVGSIGPTRGRVLNRLRSAYLHALGETDDLLGAAVGEVVLAA